jgi:hypothetical protein
MVGALLPLDVGLANHALAQMCGKFIGCAADRHLLGWLAAA